MLSKAYSSKIIDTAYKAFVRSRLEYGNLVYWSAADTHLKKLDRVQRSFSKTLEKPSWIPTLEERRKAAAVGLTCKLLDNKGRGQLQSLKPTFLNDENNVRRSKRLNSLAKHKYQLQNEIHPRKSLEVFRRCYRGRIPDVWNNLQTEVLHENNENDCFQFQKHRKILQKELTMFPKAEK